MQALVQHKLQHQVEQLAALGFAPAAALAAVQQHGGNLEGALVTLLEQVGCLGLLGCGCAAFGWLLGGSVAAGATCRRA